MLSKIKPYILLAPVLMIILGVFVSGLMTGLLQSIGYFPAIGLKEFTFKYYKEVFSDPNFIGSLNFSLYISLISSVLAVVIGVLFAYAIIKSDRAGKIEEMVYKLPIIVPHAVAALLVYSFLSQSGVLSRLLYGLGFIENQIEFPSLIFDSKGYGIIIAYLWKEIPFIAMVVYGVLKSVNDKLSDVAKNLGASNYQIFWHVLMPLILPTVTSSFIIIFAFSFGAFEVPFLLGPTTPKTLPVMAYLEYTNPDLLHRPYTMSINMILTACSLIFVWIYSKTIEFISRYNNG